LEGEVVIARRAHHVSLNVSDLERARGFYGDLLGLPEMERPDLGLPGIWYRAGEVELHLIVAPAGVAVGTRPPSTNPVAPHLAFEVESYDAVHERLLREGVAVLGAGAEVGQMWISDPDGNVIELIVPGGRLGRRG
jgi:catechol 2,3-dioxygenase-like lactoylglutathione lyase family enzyme